MVLVPESTPAKEYDRDRAFEQKTERLRENLGIEWTTFAQVNFRLLWLINLGKVRKETVGYVLA